MENDIKDETEINTPFNLTDVVVGFLFKIKLHYILPGLYILLYISGNIKIILLIRYS